MSIQGDTEEMWKGKTGTREMQDEGRENKLEKGNGQGREDPEIKRGMEICYGSGGGGRRGEAKSKRGSWNGEGKIDEMGRESDEMGMR